MLFIFRKANKADSSMIYHALELVFILEHECFLTVGQQNSCNVKSIIKYGENYLYQLIKYKITLNVHFMNRPTSTLCVQDYIDAFLAPTTKRQYKSTNKKIESLVNRLLPSEGYFANGRLSRPMTWEHVNVLLLELLVLAAESSDIPRSADFFKSIRTGIIRIHTDVNIIVDNVVDTQLHKFIGGYAKVIAQLRSQGHLPATAGGYKFFFFFLK
jgi:hypothetical protein